MDLILDLAVIAWVALIALSLLDALGKLLFWPVSYLVGVRVLKQLDAQLPRPTAALETVFETSNGKYKLVSSERVLVRERTRIFARRADVRGSITWGPEGAVVEARIPVPAVLVALLLAGITVVMPILTRSADLVLVALFAVVIIGVNLYMSRRQMLALLEEYRACPDATTAARLTSASS